MATSLFYNIDDKTHFLKENPRKHELCLIIFQIAVMFDNPNQKFTASKEYNMYVLGSIIIDR